MCETGRRQGGHVVVSGNRKHGDLEAAEEAGCLFVLGEQVAMREITAGDDQLRRVLGDERIEAGARLLLEARAGSDVKIRHMKEHRGHGQRL